jgi:integrase
LAPEIDNNLETNFERPLVAGCTHPTCAQAESGPPQPAQNQTSINQLESDMETKQTREPWNKGKLVGQKPPLKLKDIWAIRIHLQNGHSVRDLALFNIAIESKLRGCDLVNLRVRDVMHASQVLPRAMIVQRKTQRPVQFELTEPTRSIVFAWVDKAHLKPEQYLFPSRLLNSPHVSTRQYARIVHQWVAAIGLDPTIYGTHTMRRTKATLIYKRTKNLRAVQLSLGHSKIESTVQYLGIEVDDALEISEQTEI